MLAQASLRPIALLDDIEMPLITGTPGHNALFGTMLADTIEGLAGNDTLFGSLDADVMDGGEGGADRADYGDSPAGVDVSLVTGLGAGGDAAGDMLTGIEQLAGSQFDDTLIGDGGANRLMGREGDDTLSGGAGADTIMGGPGADDLSGGSGRDQLIYSRSVGAVTIDLDAGTAAGGEAQGDTISGFESVAGSAFGDHITGDAQGNRLAGREGNDTLLGGDGRDTVNGGDGADILAGGDGIDLLDYAGSDAAVTVDLATLAVSGGDAEGDTISDFENVRGSDHGDHITGDAQRNKLFGLDGNDTLNGGAGNDVLIGGRGADVFNGGDGFDVVTYHLETQSVSVNTRTPHMLGAAAGDSFISIEAVRGTQFGDSLILGDENNRLIGLDGDDFLDGGGGNDTLNGGPGADFLHGGEGIDTVTYKTSDAGVFVSLTLGPNTGGDAEGDTFSWIHNIKGSMHSDSIEGDLLDNKLFGLDGDDTLIGRAGADTLTGGDGADTFVFVAQDEHPGQVQGDMTTLSPYAGGTPDHIRDFESGTDTLQFDAAEFSGPVVNTGDLTDLGFDSVDDSAFVYDGMNLYYVDYASQTDFDAGQVTVRHIAQFDGVADLTVDDFAFV
ncbi:MAG: calcium-binding protein [Phycisphaerales bacterium]